MTPGEASRQVQALLRHNGYGADKTIARAGIAGQIPVTGRISDLKTGDDRGAFKATVDTNSIVIHTDHGIISEYKDPFAGL